MPRPILRDEQGDFRGGLNLAADDVHVGENEVRRADEAVLTQYGAINKRLGSQYLNDSALSASHAVQNGYTWLKDDGTEQLLAVVNGTLYQANYGIPTTWTAISGSLKTTGAPSMVGFRDATGEVVYIADGDTTNPALNKWNGTTLTTHVASTPTTITQICLYNQRLFGITGGDSKIYWSGLNNGDSLGVAASGGGEAIIRTFGDQKITGLAVNGASLLVFHETGISKFTGLTQDDIAIAAGAQGVTNDVGCVAPRSIVSTPDVVFFLSDRGFYAANESAVRPISLKLDPLIKSLDFATTENVIGAHNRIAKEIWWYLPDKGIYRFNYALGAWTGPCAAGYTDPVTTCLWESIDGEEQPIVLAGDEDGFVKQADVVGVYRDNASTTGTGGTSYGLTVRLRRLYCGDSLQFKAFKYAYVLCGLRGSATAGVTWLTQNGSGVYTLPNEGAIGEWGTGTWGTGTWGAGATKPTRVPINGYGQYIDILLTDDGESASTWARVQVEGFDYGRRY